MRAEADIPGIVEFSHRVPGKPLSDFVQLFWYWIGHPHPYAKECILPMGSVELIIQLNNSKVSHSGMTGPRSESFLIERRATDQLLGVHFKPGGAFPFLGFPYAELHNKQITLADLWGERLAGRLLCLLNEARTVELKDQFYGDRVGAVRDLTGNQWWIASHKEEMSSEEMTRRAAARNPS
jgi:hypothetical protein